MNNKKLIIIGSGFSGLSAACCMARQGWHVTVLEKHATPGGRARQLKDAGFTFDMGPSWYWMPEVFENFFSCFNKKISDYYTLKRLDPSYRIYFEDDAIDVPADYEELKMLFEKIEPGSSNELDKFLKEAEYKYKVGMEKLVFRPGNSFSEFADADLIKGVFRLDVFTSVKKHISKYFSSRKLQQMLEFPVLFLGALPEKIPALYSLMNYADIKGGTWFPEGGMYSLVDAMYQLAIDLGVHFSFNTNVKSVIIKNNMASGVEAEINQSKEFIEADAVISSADYHHTENNLLPDAFRNYSENWWDKKQMAPGCILYYVGISKKLKNVLHHSLFFDTSFEQHGKEIYDTKQWPSNPLFYVSATSVTDESLAPPGCENLFFLIPAAAGLTGDTEELREKYFTMIAERFEQRTGEKIRDHIIYKKSYAHKDFVYDYNAYKGNAYGLANTLMQTANFKPALRNKKAGNVFYTGQLTVPGPGVPPAIISGQVVANEVIKSWGK